MHNMMITIDVLTAMTNKEINNKNYWENCRSNAYKVARWVFGGNNSAIENILYHLSMADAIIKNGKRTFYVSDLFENAGRYIQGMQINQVIRPTGNTRKVFIDFGDGYGKTVDANEWELVTEFDEFATLIKNLRFYLAKAVMGD